ncbi:alpha/beta-hydrolase [Apiospora aurea]|uniref:Alpha/beta-hydrolase n=1 Tax=Apiospora aurea TaxID=335848 RepID=A0ABR1Q0A3_9PEZI
MPAVALPSKPDAVLAYELIPGDAASSLLVVFLNGLGFLQSVWKPAIELFQQQSTVSPRPWLLTYDRYGQGGSSRDPRENWPSKDPGYAHTLDDVTDDLQELIQTVSPDRHSRIVFVNNNIGAQVARRYAEKYPKLKGSKTSLEKGLWVTVVGHELEQFSREEWTMLKVPIGMAAIYTQPEHLAKDKGPMNSMWHNYNEGLCGLTDRDRAKGPLIAPKSGHFIQKDNPAFVAKELQDLVEKAEASSV